MQDNELTWGVASGHATAFTRVSGVCRQPPAAGVNVLLISVVLGGTLLQLFGMPTLLRAFGIRAACLLLPIVLLQPLHWGLIHEAIHCRLLPKRRTGEFWARLLSVAHWLPFDATRFCHLVHHRYSRHAYDRPDVHETRGAYALAWLRYRGRLLGGVYLGLLASPLIAFMPPSVGVRLIANSVPIREPGDTEVRRLLVSLVTNGRKRQRTRLEFVAALALYGTSAWVYGAWWPMLLAAMGVRGLWHSLADNVAHHDVGLNEPERARNHALPPAFAILVMNQHLHLTHHRHPTAPWAALVRISAAEGEQPHDNYFRRALQQLALAYPLITEKPAVAFSYPTTRTTPKKDGRCPRFR
jgi:fatty acid desaturase